jgi:hypothetical protein
LHDRHSAGPPTLSAGCCGQASAEGSPGAPNPTTEELLDLLAAILDTLTIEPPTTGEDDASRRALAVQEHGRLLVHRALLVHVALENFQRDPDAYPAARTAAWLREQAAIARGDR